MFRDQGLGSTWPYKACRRNCQRGAKLAFILHNIGFRQRRGLRDLCVSVSRLGVRLQEGDRLHRQNLVFKPKFLARKTMLDARNKASRTLG